MEERSLTVGLHTDTYAFRCVPHENRWNTAPPEWQLILLWKLTTNLRFQEGPKPKSGCYNPRKTTTARPNHCLFSSIGKLPCLSVDWPPFVCTTEYGGYGLRGKKWTSVVNVWEKTTPTLKGKREYSSNLNSWIFQFRPSLESLLSLVLFCADLHFVNEIQRDSVPTTVLIFVRIPRPQ